MPQWLVEVASGNINRRNTSPPKGWWQKVLEATDKMKYANKTEKRNVNIMHLRGRKQTFRDCVG